MSSGEQIPCSAETVTVELMGDAAEFLDEQIIKNAAEAVLHYFKAELGRTSVSVAEFSRALEQVLRGFGLDVHSPEVLDATPRVVRSDLEVLADELEHRLELSFFQRLRTEMQSRLEESPQVIHFTGLRGCVRLLTGAKRWGARCQALNDQIVEFLRTCLSNETCGTSCALLVQ